MADYHQALELDPSDRNIRIRIAVIHNEFGVQDFQAKNFEDAENRFSLAIQHSPHVSNYYISRCRARQMLENHTGARQDILISLLLDPTNPELMPILTRLYPGKSVKDILQSKAAAQARQALENLVVTASPVMLGSLREKTAISQEEMAAKEAKTDETTSLWQLERSVPDLKACMEEREFHIKLATEKKKYNTKVKKILQNRPALERLTASIKPPPPEADSRQQSGNRVPASAKLQVKPVTGWRNFGFGVSLTDAPN